MPSFDELKGKKSYRQVTELFVRETDLIFKVAFSTGEKLETTWNHPFWIMENHDKLERGPPAVSASLFHGTASPNRKKPKGKWVAAKDLKPGQKALTVSGRTVTVTDVSQERRSEKVYNFAVQENHTYYVGQDGVLVHNESYTYTSYPKGYSGKFADEKYQTGTFIREANPGDREKILTVLNEMCKGICKFKFGTDGMVVKEDFPGVSIADKEKTMLLLDAVFENSPFKHKITLELGKTNSGIGGVAIPEREGASQFNKIAEYYNSISHGYDTSKEVTAGHGSSVRVILNSEMWNKTGNWPNENEVLKDGKTLKMNLPMKEVKTAVLVHELVHAVNMRNGESQSLKTSQIIKNQIRVLTRSTGYQPYSPEEAVASGVSVYIRTKSGKLSEISPIKTKLNVTESDVLQELYGYRKKYYGY